MCSTILWVVLLFYWWFPLQCNFFFSFMKSHLFLFCSACLILILLNQNDTSLSSLTAPPPQLSWGFAETTCLKAAEPHRRVSKGISCSFLSSSLRSTPLGACSSHANRKQQDPSQGGGRAWVNQQVCWGGVAYTVSAALIKRRKSYARVHVNIIRLADLFTQNHFCEVKTHRCWGQLTIESLTATFPRNENIPWLAVPTPLTTHIHEHLMALIGGCQILCNQLAYLM